MKDFIFGTLATEELRLKHVRTRRAGVSHAYQRSPRDPLPGEEIRLDLSVGPGFSGEHAWVYWTVDGSDPKGNLGIATTGVSTPMETGEVEWDTTLWGYIRWFKAILPAQAPDTIIRYYLSIATTPGEEIKADGGRLYSCYIADDPPPTWAQDAIIYQIFVDRFFPGNEKSWLAPTTPAGFYGGTLTGIIEKLAYLEDLGINTLWLTPIFPSPSHHGYDAVDLFDIEPRLGTRADLRDLLNAAHGCGMRVLLDLVPNHLSNQHPYFQNALSDNNSLYNSWFLFNQWPNKYESFFDVPELPRLNLREPLARQYILDAAAYWLEMGVDGYRIDYAIGPAADFWADFRRTTRKSNPESWTFGEVVEPPDSQLNFSGGLDGCLDFNLMEAMRGAFAYGDWTAEKFSSFLNRHEAYFPPHFSRPSFLDNHDMNRFLWAANGDLRRLRLAALCQFTLAGAPIIYYGTEVGLSQLRDVRQDGLGLPEESRLPMLWDSEQDKALFEFYKRLIRARKEYPQLRQGTSRVIQAGERCLLYTRGDSNEILVALNLSGEEISVELTDPWSNIIIATGTSEARVRNSSLTLAPLGGGVFINPV